MKKSAQELPKAYDAKLVDQKWYQFWEDHRCFSVDLQSKKPPYCIIMPPPNVTGVLHMGHALGSTLQDILIRWKRMCGYEVLWVPGTDHAGIATQTIVERNLMKSHGKKRKDFSREEFLEHVWKWKEHSQTHILGQLKRLGCSCDWSTLRFTMDEGNNRAVRTMFKKLYDADLIYRGDYLVNWDPVTQTALADDEVEYEERASFLWFFKYPLTDRSGYVVVATTRPETMLGDTAIAVSPKDPRYQHLVGKKVILPLMEREIPIISDFQVDPEFGTGAVKVTPAHDPNDYQIGNAHQLERINIMTPDGKINEKGGKYRGLTMEEARQAVVADMKKLGLVEKIQPHTLRVGVSYRSKAKIEPYMSKQWFVRMSGFAKQMREAVEKDKTRLIPKNWENTYFHWIDHLRDWCISRQLWWGHRIPIWYHKNDPSTMICYDGEGLPPEVQMNPNNWVQDEDVLDTWFSSALWPFSTLGWPDQSKLFEQFYPNAVLVTGYDILFFWVARMIMMGEYATGKTPFPEALITGLIYGKSYWRNNPDGGITYISEKERHDYDLGKPIAKDVHFKWEKMSKSKGNIIDPIEVIEEYGTDAIRMALCASATQSREIDLDRRKFEEFRHFANKIWNGARFVFLNLEGDESQGVTAGIAALTANELIEGLNEDLFLLEDRWILSRLNRIVDSVHKKLATYQFDQSALEAYDFFWKDFCAYYLEISKPILFGKIGTQEQRKNKQKLLVIILCQAVRLMHPMAPFITEEIFQILKARFQNLENKKGIDPYTQECVQALTHQACILSLYPTVIRQKDIDLEIEATFEKVEKIIYTVRNIRGEMKLPPSTATKVQIIGSPQEPYFELIKQHSHIIASLVKTSGIEMATEEPRQGFASVEIVGSLKIYIPMPEHLIQQEILRLSKERDRLKAMIERGKKQLENPDFLKNAPPALLDKQKETLRQAEKEHQEIESKIVLMN